MEPQTEDSIVQYYRDVLPLPNTFHQEVRSWQHLWAGDSDKPKTLTDTLQDARVCSMMYPNITTILHLLLSTSVTSCGVERAYSSLKFVNNPLSSTMSQDRSNALVLVYLHRDIKIDPQHIVDMFVRM